MDPEKVRRFAEELQRFNSDLENRMIQLQARLGALGDSWQDQDGAAMDGQRQRGRGGTAQKRAARPGPKPAQRSPKTQAERGEGQRVHVGMRGMVPRNPGEGEDQGRAAGRHRLDLQFEQRRRQRNVVSPGKGL